MSLEPDHYDLLVVGGGINGVGIARDAAGQGLRVCVIEQSDLASCTSSASTKLIHGGLRYLEYREFRLVRESLTERERLLGIAPHLIHPVRFLFPYTPGLRPRWQIRLGLFVYDHVGGRKRLPSSAPMRFAGAACGSPLRGDIVHGFAYSDCSVDDSRLVVLNALDAATRGAVIVTRMQLHSAQPQAHGLLAKCLDLNTGQIRRIRARALINASGAWVNAVRDSVGLRGQDPLRLIQGSHIVVPRLFAGDEAYILQNPDRRIVFVIPYEQHYTLIGTTDVPFEGDPRQVRITADEIAYLCESVNRYFRRPLTPEEILWSYAGVRTLRDDKAAAAAAVTRDYDLKLERLPGGAPVLSIIGGKLTTYRKLAEAALSRRAAPARPHQPQLDGRYGVAGRRSAGGRLHEIPGTGARSLAVPECVHCVAAGAGLWDAYCNDSRRGRWVRGARRNLRRRAVAGRSMLPAAARMGCDQRRPPVASHQTGPAAVRGRVATPGGLSA